MKKIKPSRVLEIGNIGKEYIITIAEVERNL